MKKGFISMQMNNERFFDGTSEPRTRGCLIEVLGLWFINRQTDKLPKIVYDDSLIETEVIGDTLYTPEVFTDEIEVKTKAVLTGEHNFAKKAEALYEKYSPDYSLDNALDFITDEEFKELCDTIDFRYTCIANLLFLINRRR